MYVSSVVLCFHVNVTKRSWMDFLGRKLHFWVTGRALQLGFGRLNLNRILAF